MYKNNITFVIFTYNEEKRIIYPIRNFIKYGEVIIIDNFSTDKTKEVVEKLGAKVYQYKNPGYVETQEELDFVRSKVKTDYMTRSFADHMWSRNLLEKTVEITRQGVYDGIATIQKNYHYGIEKLNFFTYSFKGKRDSQHVRIYKKGLLYCNGIIHTNPKNNCENIFYMPISDKFFVHHLSLYNVKKFELSHSNYSDIEAKMKFESGEKVSFFILIFKLSAYFIKFYFFDGAWRSGKGGYIMVMQYIFFMFNIGAKQWELENNITLTSIENNYNKIREKILKNIEN